MTADDGLSHNTESMSGAFPLFGLRLSSEVIIMLMLMISVDIFYTSAVNLETRWRHDYVSLM
jgi:hypothetical protein